MSKRLNNEGAIYESPKGSGIWWAQLPADDQGKRPRRQAKSKEEAGKKLEKMQRDRERGLNLAKKRPTVDEYAATWLDTVVSRHRKPSTVASYTYIVRHYILPRLGHIRIDQINVRRVRQFVNHMMDEDFSPDTVRNAYMRLRGMLQSAVDEGVTSYNLSAKIELPKARIDVARILSIPQAQTLLATVEEHRLSVLYYIYLILGLRRGEGLGLRWSDVNREVETIDIRQQIQIIENEIALNTPKNDKTRTLPLSPELVAMLQEHEKNQREERELAGAQWQEHGLIFPSEVGTPMNPNNLLRHFKLTLQAANLEHMRLHDLRHTSATLLADLGTEERIIAAILGHGPKNITRRYSHTTIETMRKPINQLSASLTKSAT